MDIRKNATVNLAVYGLATLGTMLGGVLDSHPLIYICKPAMLLVLSSWFFFNTRRVGDRLTLLIQAGLFFSLVGDVALMFQHVDEFNFLVGLAAFLLAQLCYTIAFVQNVVEVGAARTPWLAWLLAFGIGVYGWFFAGRVIPAVDDGIRIPVAIYALAITAMGMLAAFRWGRTFQRSFVLVFSGSLFFILSDSLLAIDRFLAPFEASSWVVILTYAVAQLLIVLGILSHVLDPEEIRRKAALTT